MHGELDVGSETTRKLLLSQQDPTPPLDQFPRGGRTLIVLEFLKNALLRVAGKMKRQIS